MRAAVLEIARIKRDKAAPHKIHIHTTHHRDRVCQMYDCALDDWSTHQYGHEAAAPEAKHLDALIHAEAHLHETATVSANGIIYAFGGKEEFSTQVVEIRAPDDPNGDPVVVTYATIPCLGVCGATAVAAPGGEHVYLVGSGGLLRFNIEHRLWYTCRTSAACSGKNVAMWTGDDRLFVCNGDMYGMYDHVSEVPVAHKRQNMEGSRITVA